VAWGDALRLAIQKGVTPGGAGLISTGTSEGPRHTIFAGKLGHGADDANVDHESIYDLASLTKVLSTTVLAAQAISLDKLDLDECPWPRWPAVCVKHILRHTAGLADWLPLYKEVEERSCTGLPKGRDIVLNTILKAKPLGNPDDAALYSDLGFIALGALLEERLGQRLDVLTQDFWSSAVGHHTMVFVPLYEVGYHPDIIRVAPTENCPWRKRVIRGQVHDDNCFAMGGIAGHAGMFGTLADVEKSSRYLLSCIQNPASPTEQLIKEFAESQGVRPLGFDRVTEGGSTGGVLSSHAVGHLGFTGTSMWLDPSTENHPHGTISVMLCNRVHESRSKTGIKELRQQFHRESMVQIRES
jgi:serine-type D-Ala-D-Ala carboxypeptidase